MVAVAAKLFLYMLDLLGNLYDLYYTNIFFFPEWYPIDYLINNFCMYAKLYYT